MNTSLFPDEHIRNCRMVDCDFSELTSLVEDLALIDLRCTGNKLTWCNNQDAETILYCKLDRALMFEDWLTKFGTSEAVFLSLGSSDHCPCLIRTKQGVEVDNHIFRYCDMWAKDPAFQGIFSYARGFIIHGIPTFRGVKKLKEVKKGLKHLHMSEYENILARVNMYKE